MIRRLIFFGSDSVEENSLTEKVRFEPGLERQGICQLDILGERHRDKV